MQKWWRARHKIIRSIGSSETSGYSEKLGEFQIWSDPPILIKSK